MEPVVQRLSENSRRITMTPVPEALDLTHLDYISSAGLRVILKVHKALAKKGPYRSPCPRGRTGGLRYYGLQRFSHHCVIPVTPKYSLSAK